jgi:hypothetical protein
MEKTAAELQAEIEASQKQLQALQEQERKLAYDKADAERKEKARIAKQEQYNRYVEHATAIAIALNNAGFKALVNDYDPDSNSSYPTISNDADTDLRIYFRNMYGRQGTCVIVSCGFHQQEHRYPKNAKTGLYNYAKIAETAAEMDGFETSRKEENNRKSDLATQNKAIVTRLVNKYGVPAYRGANYKDLDNCGATCSPSGYGEGIVNVKFQGSYALTEAEAAYLLDELKTLRKSVELRIQERNGR